MIKRIRNWFQRLFYKRYNPPHICKIFRYYYGVNTKICEHCGKEAPIGEAHFILHQR